MAIVDEFISEPYKYFTEADVVTDCHYRLINIYTQKTQSIDNIKVDLVHREYPTFFRFDDKNPTRRLDKETGAKRGHYDVAILNPLFVQSHEINTIVNREIRTEEIRNKGITPLQAVIEFKLFDRSISKGRFKGIICEIDKLLLSEESEEYYFVYLQRYKRTNTRAWDRYYGDIEKKLRNSENKISSVIAVNWLAMGKEPKIMKFGDWKY